MDAFDNPAKGGMGSLQHDGVPSGQVSRATTGGDMLAGTAAVTAAAAAIPLAIQGVLVPDARGRVVLPAGVSIDDITVSGTDLIIALPSGQVLIIPNGAINVPTIVVDGNVVPGSTVAQLLEGLDDLNPEAGVRSSGGNFADPEGNIQDAYALGDLLPYTELAFPAREDEELVPDVPDEEPTTVIITPDQPAGSANATASVDEAGLPARGNEPAGSNSAANSETTSGSILFSTPDGFGSITLNGVAVTAVGQVFTTPFGQLVITSIAPGNIGYTYTLTDNSNAGTNPADVFVVVVTDRDGDTATANLTITIVDDAPTARADTDSVAPATFTAETGNVITGTGTTSGTAGADTQGADGAVLNGITAGTGTTFTAPGTVVQGQYGTLTIDAQGNYSYVRSPNTPGGVTDVFTYRLVDGDGDTSTATLTISIGDSPSIITFIPTEGAGTLVNESRLPPRGEETPGSAFDGGDETTTGTITFTSRDGVGSVTINGVAVAPDALPQQISSDATGTLVITSYSYDPVTGQGSITYSYTLNDNTLNPDGTTVSFDVVVTDLDGDVAAGDLNIRIIDDVPTARNDIDSVTEDGPLVADGNVLTGAGGGDANATDGVADTPGADGATVSATLTITINGADDGVTITGLDVDGGELLVDEANLPNGSSPDAGALTQSGSFSFATPDGLGDVTIGGTQVVANGVFTAGTATSPLGTVNITGFTPVVGADGSVIGGTFTYEYVLVNNTLAHAAPGEDNVTDSFAVTVTDSDGSVANASLDVVIIDDVPTARNDIDSVTEDGPLVADGNVLTGAGGGDANATDGVADTPGADGATVTDGDGDTSSATLTITINGADDGVTITGLDGAGAELLFDEDDLPARAGEPAGSDPAPEPVTDGGSFSVATPDGMGSVVIDSFNGTPIGPLTLVTADGAFTPQSVATAYGTLNITGFTPVLGADGSVIGGTFTYEYTLADNRADHNALGEDSLTDSIGITVTDSDGSTASATIDIQITDDVPTAVDDFQMQSVENQPVTIDVLANDIQGADGVQPSTVALVDGSLTGAGTLVNNGDGTFTYTQAPGEVGEVSFDYQVTDGDGDTSVATATIMLVADSTPQIRNVDNVTVDEDGLLGANADDGLPGEVTSTGSATANGTITVDFGGDVPTTLAGSLVLDDSASLDTQLTVDGVPVTFAKDGDDLVGRVGGNEVIRITLTTATAGPGASEITYGYMVTLSAAIDQMVAGSEDTEILSGIGFTVTDNDGSSASGVFNVTIVDDIPTLNVSDTPTNATEGGPAVAGTWSLDAGADGVETIEVTFGNSSETLALTPGSFVVIVQPTGTLTVNADGTFTFLAAGDQNNGLNPAATFTLSAVDRDGDPTSDTLMIVIDDGANPVGGDTLTLTVNEAAIDGMGSTPVSNAEIASGTLAFTAGSDTLSGFVFDGVAGLVANLDGVGTDIFWTLSPDGKTIVGSLTDGGPAAITIGLTAPTSVAPGITATVTVTVTLADNLPHALAMAAQTQALGTVTVKGTDTDGDVATGVVTIEVVDDIPTAAAEPVQSLAEGTTVSGAFDFVPGADGASLTAINGNAVTFNPDGWSNWIDLGLGELRVKADGSYEFKADAATLSPVAPITGTFTVTDGDNDTATAGFSFQINDANTPTGGSAAATVDDDGLLGGNPASGPVNGPATFSGTLGGSVGLDGAGANGFTFTGNTTGTVGLETVSYAVVGNVLTATITSGPRAGTTLFTVEITDKATGAYTVTLLDNVLHAGGSNGENPVDPTAAITYTITDADGSSVPGNTLTITFDDDAPTAVLSTAGLSLAHDETPGIDGDAQDVAGPLAIFDGVANKGDDPHVAGTVIGFARDIAALSSTGSTFGADGVGTISFGLALSSNGVDSGLDTTDGQNILLYLEDGIVVGRVGGPAGVAAFAIAVEADGSVSVVQYLSIKHPTTGASHDESVTIANGAILATLTIADGDGDTASTSAPIGGLISFQDDGPTLGAFVGVTVINAANVVGSGTFAYSQGADGHGSFMISGPPLPGITYTTTQNANGALLTATTDPDGPGGNAPITVFTLQVNADGTYAFTLVTPQAASTETISLLGLSAGGPSPFVQTADGRVEFSGSGNGINSSTQGFGVDNQFVGNGESFSIEFHNPGQPGDQASTVNPEMVSSIVLRNDQINGSLLIKVTVFNDVLGTSEVVYASLNVTGTTTLIDPVMAEFNRVLVEGVGGSGQGVRFVSLDISKTILPSDIDLQFQVNAIDGDGDISAISLLNVSIDAGNPPIVLDLDGDGIEYLSITAGVTFDYAGNGTAVGTAWVGPNDGMLVFDANGNGKVDNGTEIVFGGNGLTDLQGLAARFDTNKDGIFDAADADFGRFGVWQDANSNGVTDAGEFRTLDQAGIVSITLVSDGDAYSTANGSVYVYGETSYRLADGTIRTAADAAFATSDEKSALIGAVRTQDRPVSTMPMTDALVAASLVAFAGGAAHTVRAEPEALAVFATVAGTQSQLSATEISGSTPLSLGLGDDTPSATAGSKVSDGSTAAASGDAAATALPAHAEGVSWQTANDSQIDAAESTALFDLVADHGPDGSGIMDGLLLLAAQPASQSAEAAIAANDPAADAVLAEVMASDGVDLLLNAIAGGAPELAAIGDTPTFDLANFLNVQVTPDVAFPTSQPLEQELHQLTAA
ncbi:MAG: hypothetical protein CVT78_13830 [Alphaproteobacteria bacterium HGW-Alphaproteobacteria-17]|nr:MAG: hypothetical protein CVT78_13830 [Alphaproteobacteria bacterium HGW-Alphaproteobacteria-17]